MKSIFFQNIFYYCKNFPIQYLLITLFNENLLNLNKGKKTKLVNQADPNWSNQGLIKDVKLMYKNKIKWLNYHFLKFHLSSTPEPHETAQGHGRTFAFDDLWQRIMTAKIFHDRLLFLAEMALRTFERCLHNNKEIENSLLNSFCMMPSLAPTNKVC